MSNIDADTPPDPDAPRRPQGGFSRRDMFVASVIAGLSLSVIGQTTAQPAHAAAAPVTGAGVAALALSLQGKTLAQLQSQFMLEGSWHTYQGDWCAVFASWLTRGGGVPYTTTASLLYSRGTPVSTPAVGDIVHYYNNGHVGVVVDVINGVARTVEGNTKTHPWPQATVNSFKPPWAVVRFSRPHYSAAEPPPTTPPPTIRGQDMYVTTATNGSAYLITPFGVVGITDPAHRDLFIRLLNSPANAQVFLQVEVDTMARYINSLVR
jgi:hypothetical protein